VAKSKFTAKKPKKARKPRKAGGKRSNAWRQYVSGGRGGAYVPTSTEPIPD
jgi:hypothetical protein